MFLYYITLAKMKLIPRIFFFYGSKLGLIKREICITFVKQKWIGSHFYIVKMSVGIFLLFYISFRYTVQWLGIL